MPRPSQGRQFQRRTIAKLWRSSSKEGSSEGKATGLDGTSMAAYVAPCSSSSNRCSHSRGRAPAKVVGGRHVLTMVVQAPPSSRELHVPEKNVPPPYSSAAAVVEVLRRLGLGPRCSLLPRSAAGSRVVRRSWLVVCWCWCRSCRRGDK